MFRINNLYVWIRDNFVWIVLAGLLGYVLLRLIFVYRKKNWLYYTFISGMLVIYVAAMLYVTLGMRFTGTLHVCKPCPLGSYIEYAQTGDQENLIQNAANIMLFIPCGVFVKEFFRKRWHLWQCIVLAAFCSLILETIQIIWKLGTFEVDDILHNAFGAAVGFLIAGRILDMEGILRKKIKESFLQKGKRKRES